MWPFSRRLVARIGGHKVEDARLLADAMPAHADRLDDRTIADLELGQVFATIDRTRTATGAQVLWQWFTAPTQDVGVLAEREARIAAVTAASDRVATAIGAPSVTAASDLPQLLWGPSVRPRLRAWIVVSLVAIVALVVLSRWWSPAIAGAMMLFAANIVVDDWSKLRLARTARALESLDELLARAHRVARAVPELAEPIAADLELRGRLRRRTAVLRAHDPFELLDFLRAGLLVRVIVTHASAGLVETERERLQRIVVWLGEMDAMLSIATLRGERDTHVPELIAGPAMLVARDIKHPAIENAIGNDVELHASGLLVTGSNMSGKSTLLRTIATTAILAQSIHTTFGAWRASPLHVRAVMRIADDPERGLSTYAVEVAAMRELVADDRRCLFVIDEPFSGTSPTVRVPIVVAVLEYLVARGLVVVATHDLDVAVRLDDRFARAYFDEQDGVFDRRLCAGVAPATNAVEILVRADYPAAITDRLAGASRARPA